MTRGAASATGRESRLTLEQLRTFVAVAEREHVTAAARALRMSQGSVSAQVRRLERSLGVPLLHRVGRNVRLTDVGRAVRRISLGVLQGAQTIEELAAGYLAIDTGEISVAAGMVIGAHRLGEWLAPFVHQHPQVDVRITTQPMRSAIEALSAGAVDVAIVGSAVHDEDLETLPLERTELVIVVSAAHPLATAPHPLREIERHRHLAHEQGSATRLHGARMLGEGFDQLPTSELEEGALLAALHAGLGYAVMPRSVVEADIAAGRLVTIPHRGRRVHVVFTAARRPAAQTPAVEALWRHLAAVASAGHTGSTPG